jgi:hypothetical protein
MIEPARRAAFTAMLSMGCIVAREVLKSGETEAVGAQALSALRETRRAFHRILIHVPIAKP